MAETLKPGIELDSSSISLLDKSTLYSTLIPIGRGVPVRGLLDISLEAGYEGLEWAPVRFGTLGWQMHNGALSREEKDGIRSFQQSFRSEKTIFDSLKHQNPVFALYAYALLPQSEASLDDLEKLQKVLGKEMPVVLYPRQLGEKPLGERPFSQKTYQAMPDAMEFFGAINIEEMVRAGKKLGFTGVTYDSHLARMKSEDGLDLGPWQESLPQLLPHIQEIHISAGRVDLPGPQVDTMKELRDLLFGTRETDINKILEAIKSSGWTGRTVTIAPAAAIRSALYPNKRFLTPGEVIEGHRRIVDNVKTALF